MGSGTSISIGMVNSQSHTLKKAVKKQGAFISRRASHQLSSIKCQTPHDHLDITGFNSRGPKRRIAARWAQNRFPDRNPCQQNKFINTGLEWLLLLHVLPPPTAGFQEFHIRPGCWPLFCFMLSKAAKRISKVWPVFEYTRLLGMFQVTAKHRQSAGLFLLDPTPLARMEHCTGRSEVPACNSLASVQHHSCSKKRLGCFCQ